jgi:hypothetical protein
MLRQSWLNLAANYFNVGRSTDARSFAEKVIDDEQFGARARTSGQAQAVSSLTSNL